MKIYLDDCREAPNGWLRTYTVEETIEHLRTRKCTHLSLDNDLGEGLQEGYKVLDFLEETVYHDMHFPMPEITIHSSNSARVGYMQRVVLNIEKIRRQQVGGT